MNIFRKYGFAFILFILFSLSVSFYWHQTYAYTRSEAETHKVEWTEDDQRTEFWNGVWENMESEFGQLLVQFLGMVVFANYIAYKEEEKQDQILEELKEIRDKLNAPT